VIIVALGTLATHAVRRSACPAGPPAAAPIAVAAASRRVVHAKPSRRTGAFALDGVACV
jgi:hypothetical protein